MLGAADTTDDATGIGIAPVTPLGPVEWCVGAAPIPYAQALAVMEARAVAVAEGRSSELVWLVEHPALYTAGTSADEKDLLDARFPVHRTGRGGQFTYHGPGQRVLYLMLDLRRRRPDVRRFVATVEEWMIRALAHFDVRGERRSGRVGVWVRRPEKGEGCEDKIGAIGIRLKRWVSLHGASLNVDPDLSHFSGIVPCGVADARYGVTSLRDLGRAASIPEVDAILRREFAPLFGPAEAIAGDPPELAALRSNAQTRDAGRTPITS